MPGGKGRPAPDQDLSGVGFVSQVRRCRSSPESDPVQPDLSLPFLLALKLPHSTNGFSSPAWNLKPARSSEKSLEISQYFFDIFS
jgi:hypothetical protein